MSDPSRIVNMASAFHDSCVLFAASDAGVFGRLAQLGQADCTTLAKELGLNGHAARLLLDGCVALGLLGKDGEWYCNSRESAAFLVPGSPGDLSRALRYNRDVYPAWGRLGELIRTGRPVESPGAHLGDDPARTRTFVMAMHARALGIGRAVVPMLDLSGCRRLLDVGGGPGTYSCLVARAHADLQCIVLDLPPVVAVARELIAEQGMSGRVDTLPGDYHEAELPGDIDAVLFFGVLHQEPPDSIRELLRRAYACLNADGRVYVMDMFTDTTRTSPKFSALFALNMALTTEHGWVFSDADVRHWMAEAGFVDFSLRSLPRPMPHWLAVARKP